MDHLTEILIQLFAILVAAKIGNEIFRRLGQPTVVGEILGGVIAGPAVFGVYDPGLPETELFAEIGVVLLLFQVGLETRLSDMRDQIRCTHTVFGRRPLGPAEPVTPVEAIWAWFAAIP